MEKIDRLGWVAGTSIVSYGLPIGIRSNDAVVLERARKRLPLGWKMSSSPRVDNLYSISGGSKMANTAVVAGSGGVGDARRRDLCTPRS